MIVKEQSNDEAKMAAEEQKKPVEEVPIQQASSNMVEVLQNSANPKHRNSEFLKFLRQLNSGALAIGDDNQLNEDPIKMQEFAEQETKRLEEEEIRQREEEKFRKEQIELIKQQ